VGATLCAQRREYEGKKDARRVAVTEEYKVREGGRSRQLNANGKDASLAKRWR
jgi:hypothetical protein